MQFLKCLVVAVPLFACTACASLLPHNGIKQTASIVDYLYPDAKDVPNMQPTVTHLRPPVRVGIAFVPGGGWNNSLPEAEKMKLLERVKSSFSQYPFIGSIEMIPTQYMRAKGGFTNLDQVARMFNVEVVALLSYDQVQFNDTNALSVLYWTIVGAYVIHGDKYDVQTMVDASVFDVKSRKLLFRAPGMSQVKGNSSWVAFSERSRAAQVQGYSLAVDQLIPQLQTELGNFKERIKSDAGFKLENKAGYSGGGSLDLSMLILAAVLSFLGLWKRRAA